MGISNEIARVIREFVPGDLLFRALMKQEKLSALQTASWLLRNIAQLNRLAMLEFNAEIEDFRVIEPPWASDVFHDLTVEPLLEHGPDNWDESGDGYIGGWLSSDLKKFFEQVAIGYPEAEISRLLLEKRWLRGQELEIDTGQKPSLAKVFLAGKNLDIITVESWVRAIDTDLRTAGLALQVAFKEHSIYLPLYCPDGHEDPGIPKRLNDKDAQVCWGDFLDSFAMDNEFPDSIGGTHQSEYRYAPDFCLMKNDCTQFFKVTGLGISTFQPSKAGEITKGNVDMLAARDRQRSAISSSANTHFQTPTSNKPEKALSQRERDTLLTIVAVLLELIQSPTAGRNSEAAVIKEMLKNYDEKPGISKRNLEQKFAEAKRILGNR